jgi:cholesterol transport system auxiliary component
MRAPSSRLRLAVTVTALALGACLSLPKPAPVELFTIDPLLEAGPVTGSGPVLLVSAPRAGPGLDGPGMAYLKRPGQLQYFARSRWVEPPARLLGPLLARALERTGRFQAVTEVALGSRPDLRLESQVVRLQQEFTERPSRVRLTLRLELTDVAARRIVGVREFEAVEPAPTEDPAGGAAAAGTAVQRVLAEAAGWCAGLGARWSAEPAGR